MVCVWVWVCLCGGGWGCGRYWKCSVFNWLLPFIFGLVDLCLSYAVNQWYRLINFLCLMSYVVFLSHAWLCCRHHVFCPVSPTTWSWWRSSWKRRLACWSNQIPKLARMTSWWQTCWFNQMTVMTKFIKNDVTMTCVLIESCALHAKARDSDVMMTYLLGSATWCWWRSSWERRHVEFCSHATFSGDQEPHLKTQWLSTWLDSFVNDWHVCWFFFSVSSLIFFHLFINSFRICFA